MQYLFFAGADFNNGSGIGFETTDQLVVVNYVAGTFRTNKVTTQVFRDTSAWYHIVVSQNGSTACNLYVNGILITSFATNVGPDASNWFINNNELHTISKRTNAASNFFDGYLTEVNFIDGQALTPASFGAIDSSTGVWSPRPYSGTYGTNGFRLRFNNTSSVAALGTDSSGNGNTWTPTNVSLTAGATYDSMLDVPVNYADGGNGRGNYCTLNPLVSGGGTLSNANLGWTGGAGSTFAHSGFGLSSGKWYCEMTVAAVGSSIGLGVYSASAIGTSNGTKSRGYLSTGVKYSNGTTTAYGASFTTNDVIGMAVDVDAGTVEFFKNNASQGVAYSDIASDLWFVTVQGGNSCAANINFGQRPFTYTPPAGFKALNTNNLPTPTIVNGANFMAAKTYTGTGVVQSISNAVNNVSFQPDLVWIKSRTPGATNHALFDSVRGTTKYLSSNTTTGETTNANTLTAFGADGFSLGTDTTLVNANANSYIAWQWKAGGAAVSNTQGTITSQVSANPIAGLSVVTYTGTGANATVGHGLGAAPKMVIVKAQNPAGAFAWAVWHTALLGSEYLTLNTSSAKGTLTTLWNSTVPTSSVFSIGSDQTVNETTKPNVAYCFAEIAGFSRFGSYTGNGSADGPFVFCGFRPRFVMIKRTDVAASWVMFDSSRNPSNLTNLGLIPNDPAVEFTGTGTALDILSNGIKARGAGAELNISGATYIFAAFAEAPSKYALAR